MNETYKNDISFLSELENVKYTNLIDTYINKNKNKCVNEFEIIENISRGLIWKVKKVLRYFYNDNGNLSTEVYALKKTHVNTQKKRRYYINDKYVSFLDKIFMEIKINSLLNDKENIIKLYEIMYSNTNPCLYLICEYCDMGTIMNKHKESFEYYHNFKLVSYLLQETKLEYEIECESAVNSINPRLIKKNTLNYLRKKKLSKIIFPQIFKGLLNIHKSGTIHRDLKPENVVFSSQDNLCKIIDFSHSLMIDHNPFYFNEPAGSIHFQAPELFWNTSDNYDPFKSDIWSMGVFMFLFLFERFPFDSDSEIELQISIAKKNLDFPEDFKDIDAISLLTKLLDKDPFNRLTDINLIFEDKFFN